MKPTKFLLALLCLGSGYVNASCAEQYKDALARFYNDNKEQRYESVCKIWPSTGLMIMATAIYSKDETDLAVTIIDPKTVRVISAVRENDFLTGAAIYNTGILIDTANYRLNENSVAFGIRTSWQGSSGPTPYASESLNLYELQGKDLRKVLNGMNVSQYSGEWDTHCKGSFLDRKMTLIMAPSANTYNDIVVKEDIKETRSSISGSACRTAMFHHERKQHRIHYQQNQYLAPESLRALAHY